MAMNEATGNADDGDNQVHLAVQGDVTGVTNVEAVQTVWGLQGRYLVILGVALSMIVYEIDNTTTFNYRAYALSTYNDISISTTLLAAGTILFAVCKPLYAKLADVLGRAETYLIAVVFFIMSYILCAASKNVATYAVGTLFHSIAATGMNILNDIVISDITTPRWRVFGLSCVFIPFLIISWCAGFIVESVVSEGGIGWRWGFGLLAIVLPFASSFIIVTMMLYQRRARLAGFAPRTPLTFSKFMTQTDAVGLFLLMAGSALFLVPINLAATTASRWHTPWIPTVLAVGIAIIALCITYETKFARYPVLPARYFADRAILCCLLIGLCDQMSFEGTHAYLYNWATITKGYSPLKATYLTYVNGVTQTLVSVLVGLWMAQKQYHFVNGLSKKFPFLNISLRRGDAPPSYRAILLLGSCIRLVGYGIMLRLRGTSNSDAELYIVQLVQGLGTGFIYVLIIAAAQMRVPHLEMAQVTSLVLLFSFVGAAIGDSYAGAIYNTYFRERLRARLGTNASEEVVNAVYQSITAARIPAKGTAERIAVDAAYSDIMRIMTYVALAISIVLVILCVLLCLTKYSQVDMGSSKLPGVSEDSPSTAETDFELETSGAEVPHVDVVESVESLRSSKI